MHDYDSIPGNSTPPEGSSGSVGGFGGECGARDAGPAPVASQARTANPGAALAGLRARLVAERDKARTNADLARHAETRLANEGIAAGLETALAYLDRMDGRADSI